MLQLILALRLSRISSLKSYREAVRLQKVQFWHWSRAPGKSSIFVLRRFFVFIFDHFFKGAYAGCCCLLAACLLLMPAAYACCCSLAAAACMLLLACCCLPAAMCIKVVDSSQEVCPIQPAITSWSPTSHKHTHSLSLLVSPVRTSRQRQTRRPRLLFSFLVKCLHQIWLREIWGPYILLS